MTQTQWRAQLGRTWKNLISNKLEDIRITALLLIILNGGVVYYNIVNFKYLSDTKNRKRTAFSQKSEMEEMSGFSQHFPSPEHNI